MNLKLKKYSSWHRDCSNLNCSFKFNLKFDTGK